LENEGGVISSLIQQAIPALERRRLTGWLRSTGCRRRSNITSRRTRYPGAQIALARSGSLGLQRSFGLKRIGENAAVEDRTLFLLYSQTKVLVATAIWALAEAGEPRYTDRVADLVPGFEAHGKGDITIFQVLSHQGEFPDAEVSEKAWEDHDFLRRTVRRCSCSASRTKTRGRSAMHFARSAG
jgi:CubicO group peptidase (beta-lactamase class C family)